MYLLIPGRHQLLTNFQQTYLTDIINTTWANVTDIYGKPVKVSGKIEAIIFAVTSANHSNTRRNPLPFYLRAITIETMAATLPVPVYTYGIDDVGNLDSFAAYTIKRIKHESDGLFDCTPENTLILCSTPVLRLYEKIGFTILPAELQHIDTWQHRATMPGDLVEHIAYSNNWEQDELVQREMHPAAYKVWQKYKLGQKVKQLFNDTMISSDGDLTETRDYNVYVRQMDDIAGLKYNETAAYIQPGRIGDIGCAVGSWMRLVTRDARLRESDVYGIEVSRHLFEICRQRKDNGEFAHPFVFFAQKNAVTGLVFDKNSMNTIHTSSLTHEIESYGSRQDLLQFIKNRYDELVPGGVWVNRDVVAPADKEKKVYMWLSKEDGVMHDYQKPCENREALAQHLQGLSTYARFLRFARDFRAAEGYKLWYTEVEIAGKNYIQLSLRDAAEFLSRKDYTDNWQSEMHETFCFWDFDEWQQQLKQAGFSIHPQSYATTNQWIVTHRWSGKAQLFTKENDVLSVLDYPLTHMILVGVKD